MLAVQLSPPSLASFPFLTSSPPFHSHKHTLPHTDSISSVVSPVWKDMSNKATTANPTKKSTSVFNALGSHAEKIRDVNGKPITVESTSNEKNPPQSQSMTTSSSSSRSRGGKGENAKAPKQAPNTTPAAEEDGQWETVQSSRQRAKNDEKEKKSAANTSRNWRERPQKDSKDSNGSNSANGTKDDDEPSKRSLSRNSKKNSSSNKDASTSAQPTPNEKERDKPVVKPSTAAPSKPAWGVVAPVSAASLGHSAASAALGAKSYPQTKSNSNGSSSRQPSRTTPSPPNDASTTSTSIGSPNLSATTETGSTSTVATSATATTKVDQEEEASWRSKPQKAEAHEVRKEDVPSPKVTALPPAVNAWDLRKKTISTAKPPQSAVQSSNGTPASSPQASDPKLSAPTSSSGNLSNGQLVDGAHPLSRKKKKIGTEIAGPSAAISDPTLWPDVATAAEVAKKEDEKKEKLVKKDGEEEGAVAEDSGVTSRKHKWKSIPAAELQAAADEQAENNRRQVSAKKRLAKAEGASQAAAAAKVKTRKAVSVERSKVGPSPTGDGRPHSTGPMSRSAFKPAETLPVTTEMEDVTGESDKGRPLAGSAPMSRQGSEQSRASPSKVSTQLLSPGRIINHLDGLPETSSRPMTGTVSAPVPGGVSPHVNGTGSHTVPRPPRGRDARGSFSGRGRGGFRGVNGMKGFTSPLMSANGLPADSQSKGYGMGYTYYPNAGTTTLAGLGQYGQGQQAGYDPLQAQYNLQVYSRGAPPPPMPQTVVPNIDAHRFYVLGQVEYYFSMQNLAMDFFLRQQMDSEGWIDISMIASFNRLRSLTPEVSMVKEVMELSTMLEVREDKVRLAGQESKRWVLPNAPISTFPPDPNSPTKESIFDEQQSQLSVDHEEITNMALELAGLDAPYTHAPGGVEGALMKSVVPSSTASLSNGEVGNESMEKADVDDTPATSTSGDEVAKIELR